MVATAPSPYQPGSKLEIKNHTPPQPYGAYYKNKNSVRTPVRMLVDGDGEHRVDHMSFVLSNPPLATPVPAETKSHVLTIVGNIHHRLKELGGGPYVVSCYLGTDESCQYVAKIYDGFEYALAKSENENDCMWRADLHYSREAAAYESLPLRFQGSIVPRYFGSWTFPLATGVPGRQRWVRMILIEYIHGECMSDTLRHVERPKRGWESPQPINDSLLPPEKERLDILARIVEAKVAIWWYGGVQHGDLAPRNVMISRSGPSNAVPRIVIIDFNAAYVLHRCEHGRQILASLGPDNSLPLSPIEHYWPGSSFSSRGEFAAWLPVSWATADPDESDVLALNWLVSRWKGSPNFQPPSDQFLDWQSHKDMDQDMQQHVEELRAMRAQDGKTADQRGQRETNEVNTDRSNASLPEIIGESPGSPMV